MARDPDLIAAAAAAELARSGHLLIDVRRPESRIEDGLLPGAMIVEKADVARTFGPSPATLGDLEVDRDRPLILFCSSERGSAMVRRKLLALGYRQIWHIDGGFPAWKAQGLPTIDAGSTGD